MPARSNYIGRADLLRVLEKADEAAEPRYADLLGFAPRPPAVVVPDEAPPLASAVRQAVTQKVVPADPTETRRPLQATFFAITHFDQRLESDPPEPDERQPVDESLQPLQDKDCAPRGLPLPFVPLVRRERLWPRLRQSLQQQWCAGVDLPRLLQQVATRRLHSCVPLREHRHLSREIVVLWDAADRLTPYFEDYRRLVAELHRLHGGAQLRLWRVHDGPDDVWDEWDAARVARPERWPGQPWHRAARSGQSSGGLVVPPGCRLLLLSDLGGLARQAGPHRRWLRALRRWDDDDVHVTAWVPHGPAWVMPTLAAVAEVHCLTPRLDRVRRTRGGGAAADSAARQQRQAALRDELLTRASICIHLEPELLRSLRQTSPALAAEPGVEALAWAHQPVVRSSHVSRALSPEHAPAFRRRFAELDAVIQRDVLHRVTEAHASLGRSTETIEVLIWQAHAVPEVSDAESQELIGAAQGWVQAWSLRMERDARQGTIAQGARQFAADLLARTVTDIRFVEKHQDWTSRLWALSGSSTVPEGLTVQAAMKAAEILAGVTDTPSLNFWFSTLQDELHLTTQQVSVKRDRLHQMGPVVAHQCIVTGEDGMRRRVMDPSWHVTLAHAGRPGQRLTLAMDDMVIQIAEMSCPPWASEWGRDDYGLFAAIEVNGVRQRFRYIHPGRFRMGSPEGVGDSDEHPQHDVLLTKGYWLADTPCTQALWMAVMGKNTSKFQINFGEAEHPVQNVNWDDAHTFLQRLHIVLPEGCQPTLPTEAQWEYAARAGTRTAYCWGDEPDDQLANWNEQKNGTTPVHLYPPNPWGLHDMHGNVWEWCEDDRRDYLPESIRDPYNDFVSFARALRGGSWYNSAEAARSAWRRWGNRRDRRHSVGFRILMRSSVFGDERPKQDSNQVDVTRISVSPNLQEDPAHSSQQVIEKLGLTIDHLDVLHMLLQGSTNRRIASKLEMSIETVKAHVSAICHRLGVNSRTQVLLAVSQMMRQSEYWPTGSQA